MQGKLDCQCGCGMHPNDGAVSRLTMLNKMMLATKYGEIVVDSGARCEAHNKSVGGSDKSAHTRGRAFDVRFTGGAHLFILIGYAMHCGFIRIFVNWKKRIIHIDDATLAMGYPSPFFGEE